MCFAIAWSMGSGCSGLPCLFSHHPFVIIQFCSEVASTWLLCCQPLVNPPQQWPGGDRANAGCWGAVLNYHDKFLSYLTALLSQTLFSSVYFCCRFIRYTVKCPFSSANCRYTCFMNKFIHWQNPLNIFLKKVGRNGEGEEEEIVPQVSEEAKNNWNPSAGLSYS